MVERRSPKPNVEGSSPSWPAIAKCVKERNMKKLITYYRSAREELSKVIRPTKEQVRNASISVVAVVIVITLFLALVDAILSASVTSILS